MQLESRYFYLFFGVVYSSGNDVCAITLGVYPYRAAGSMGYHSKGRTVGSIPTVTMHIFQLSQV